MSPNKTTEKEKSNKPSLSSADASGRGSGGGARESACCTNAANGTEVAAAAAFASSSSLLAAELVGRALVLSSASASQNALCVMKLSLLLSQ